MPYVSNMNDEEEQKNGQGTSPNGGGAVHLAPSSGVGTSAPGTSGGAPKNAGGQFATLDKYITANQGQAEPLAGKITGGIGQEYNTLSQGNQGVLQGISGQVASAPGYTKGDNDLLAKEQLDPVSFANDKGNVASFQKQLSNSYGGPDTAEGTSDYQAQQAKLNNAISQGKTNTTTAAGRQQLVAKNSAAPTTGVTALNTAILSQSPNALNQVQDAYKPFSNLVSGLGSGAADINKTIAAEKADAASSSKAAQGALSGQIGGLNNEVQTGLTTAQQNATAQNAATKAALTSGKMTPEALSQLGISQEQWDSLSGAQKAAATSEIVSSGNGQFQANTGTSDIDLNQWLTQQDPNAVLNAGNTANSGQYAKAQAFQSLLNGLNLDTPQMTLNPANAAQAGTAPSSLSSYDYQPALQNAQDTKTAETASAQAYADALQSGADDEHAQEKAANAAKNFGAASAVLPGAAGSIPSTVNSTLNMIKNPSIKNLGSSIGNTFDAENASAKAGANMVVKTVKNIFCFHPWTLIEMANGSLKSIWRIQVGDETRGGKVLATTRGVGTKFYWYNGVLVTGKHAVKEDGRWIRVETSPLAKEFEYLTEVVCNLVTEQHRIWANGNEFADERETDLYESLDLDESLAEMNRG